MLSRKHNGGYGNHALIDEPTRPCPTQFGPAQQSALDDI